MKRLLGLTIFCLAFAASGFSATITLDVGTNNNAALWAVTADGAVNAAPYQWGSYIGLTSDVSWAGTPITGLNVATFDGFWTATFLFDLPADAANITLDFSNLSVDDRGVLELNGTAIGSAGFNGVTGDGMMRLSAGTADVPYTLGPASGIVNSGFVVGGQNELTLILNNTFSGIYGNTQGFENSGDVIFAGFSGTVTFDSAATPEPATVLLTGLGVFVLGYLRRLRAR